MKNLKSNLSIVGFVFLLVMTTVLVFTLSASTQTRQKSDNDVSISWSPKKRQINSVDSKFNLILPDSVSSRDWVVGVMPTTEGENETVVLGLVSWKDSKAGPQTLIDGVIDLDDQSLILSSGRINLARLSAFNADKEKSLAILLKVKPGTEISIFQKGEKVLAETFSNNNGIMREPEQVGIQTAGLQKITGPSSLLGELQTRKLFQHFGKSANRGGNNQ